MPLLADTISAHLFPFPPFLLKAQENRNELSIFRRETKLRHVWANFSLRQAGL